MYKAFLIKYGEIGTKGKNRYLFEDALCRQIRRALKKIDGQFIVSKEQGRIYVECDTDFDYDEAVAKLKTVFGILWICPMMQIEDNGFDDLAEQTVKYLKDVYKGKEMTFKVRARRARKNYPLNSMEINMDLGEKILDAIPQMKVDVHKPDIELNVEIRNKINIYSEFIPGPGGMPVGTNGKATLLLSGGIDSPVAGYSGPINLHIVNFTEIQLYIYDQCPHDELTIIMRRYMMKIAEHFALKEESLGLITGESIGQVASQTMHSLAVTNEVCTLPVLRPLIGFDKQEIIDISEKIGTFETSILPFEDCCTIFVAKHPVTKPNLKAIKRSELKLREKIDELVQTAIETTETLWID